MAFSFLILPFKYRFYTHAPFDAHEELGHARFFPTDVAMIDRLWLTVKVSSPSIYIIYTIHAYGVMVILYSRRLIPLSF